MNLILLQNRYTIANIKGDFDSKIEYYQSFKIARIKKVKEDFILLIARTKKESLERYIKKISHYARLQKLTWIKKNYRFLIFIFQ